MDSGGVSAQTAETDVIRFLVGTQSLKFDNQVGTVMGYVGGIDGKCMFIKYIAH